MIEGSKKEKVNKQIKEFLTLDRYLLLLGISLLMVGIVLFVFCTVINIPIMNVTTTSNPLFFLIFGMTVLCFRHFMIITDKKEEWE